MNQKNTVYVSAIVSTYNSEQFIRGCLDDLVNQTLYKKGMLEIIVVNSNSEQNEDSVIIEFETRYDRIVYLRTNTRESIYKSWNRAIKKARGRYITNANTDDRHRKDALEVMVDVLERNQDIDVVYAWQWISNIPNQLFADFIPFDINHWDLDVRKKMFRKLRARNIQKISKKNLTGYYLRQPVFSEYVLQRGCIIGPQPLWRKRLHKEHGSFDERFEIIGDYEFWLRLMQKRVQFKLIPQILGVFYLSDTNKGFERNDQQVKERYRILHDYLFRFSRTTDKESLNNVILFPDKFVEYCTHALKMNRHKVLARDLVRVVHFPQIRKISSPSFFLKIGRICQQLDLLQETKRCYREGLKRNTSTTLKYILYYWLGETMKDDNKHQSIYFYSKALEYVKAKKGKSDFEKFMIASLYKKIGKITYAKERFNKIIEESADRDLIAKSYFHIGECLLSQKQKEMAKKQFQECTQLLPSHQKAKEYLDTLYMH